MSENPFWPPKTLDDCRQAYWWSVQNDEEYARCADEVCEMVREVLERIAMSHER